MARTARAGLEAQDVGLKELGFGFTVCFGSREGQIGEALRV